MILRPTISRRQLLRWSGQGIALAPFAGILGGLPECASAQPSQHYSGTNEQLLDEIQRGSFKFFWNETNPKTGQVKDRALLNGALNGNDNRTMSSIAATGFGLTALCIGDARGFGDKTQIKERVRATLRFLWNDLPQVHGFFYHFIDMNTGQRWEHVELSSIDSSLLLCGVLTARQYFHDAEIQDLATKIYNRVDWPWMLNGGQTFSMGWHPERGFLDARWEHYCELMMIYLLAIGSTTHPVEPETWNAWKRPTITYQGITYISGNDPIFTHQYSHAWYDFRKKKDAYTNYFENSVLATKVHKLFCLSLRQKFPDYSEDLWGISASDYVKGYTAWGGPPPQGPIDGSIVPCATGGSLPFLFDDCVRVLRTIRDKYSEKAWGLYSFADAFNPLIQWYDSDALGIDLGITMLMAENHRTGLVWETFMKNPEARTAMDRVGFKPDPAS
jgi:hypothetical protein